MRHVLVYLIVIYQRTLSPDHGWFSLYYPFGFCRFHPTCSEYAKQAILKHGTLVGGVYAIKRLLRCHPFAEPAVDPIP